MPDQSSHQAALRASGHEIQLYFAKFDPDIVLAATVNTPTVDQAFNLAITTVSGSAADVYAGFLVRVESAGGSLKGVTNVRAAGTISSGNLPIHELGIADIEIVATDVVKVYRIPFLGDKLPTDTVSFAPDNLTYTDQGSLIRPRVNSGGNFVGEVDSGQTYASVPMPGVSTTEDPNSSGTLTHLWTLLTGTLAFAPGSSNTDANPTIRAAQGYGILIHQETDATNGKSWTQFVCFQVYDPTHRPYRMISCDLTGEMENGWSAANMELYQNTDLASLPDGWMVGLYAVEYIGGVQASYGSIYAGRSAIKLIGFLFHDENSLTPQINRVTFSIQSPWQRLTSLPGFSKVFTRGASDWTNITDLTVRLAIIHLLRYYSFYMELFDLLFDSAFLNKLYSQLFIQKQTADKQIIELADGVDAKVCHLRTGEVTIYTDQSFIPIASRAAVVKTLALGKRDLLTAPFVRDHWKTVETVEVRGFTAGASNNQPVLSRYTGLTPGRGNQSAVQEKQIVDSQSDLNERAGRRGAKQDSAFLDANGLYTRAIEWTPTLPGSYDVFDFNKEYIATDLDATSNLRGVDLSAQLYFMTRMSIQYTGGTARLTLTLDTATNAPPAATYVPPVDTILPANPFAPQPPITPTPTLPGLVKGSGRIIMLNTDNNAYVTTNFQASAAQGGPAWVAIPLTLGGNNVVDWVQDPYNLNRYVIVTDGATDAIWTLDDPLGAATLTSRADLLVALTGVHDRKIECDFSSGYFYVVSCYDGDATYPGTWYTYCTDDGVTWAAETQITPHYHTSLGSGLPLSVSSHNAGRAYTAAFLSTGSSPTSAFFELNGASFSQITSPSGFEPGQLLGWCNHYPFAAGAAETFSFFGQYNGATDGTFLRNGSTVTDISPRIGGVACRPNLNRALHSCPIDPYSLVEAGDNDAGGGSGVFVSRTQGASWNMIDGPSSLYTFVEIAGNDHSVIYLCGLNGTVGYCSDFAAIDNRMGNLVTSGRNIRMFGLVG